MSNANGSSWVRKEKRLALYHRDGFSCIYCGESADDGAALSLDHVTPRELGGTHEATNLITSCVSCNSSRRDLSLRAFFVILRDKGIDTTGLAAKIRRQTRKSLDMKAGRALLAARRAS